MKEKIKFYNILEFIYMHKSKKLEMREQKQVIESFNKLILEKNVKEDLEYIQTSKVKTDYNFFRFIPGGLRNKIVLDVGAFIPFDAIYWGSVVKEFHAIDYSQEVVDSGNELIKRELSEEVAKKIKYIQANAIDLPYPDNHFDVSFSFSSIEHIPGKKNRDKAFSEIARVTKRRGYVVLTLPNKLYIYGYLKSTNLQKKGISPYGLEVWYTPRQLKKIMIKNNLKPIYFYSSAGDLDGFFPFNRIYNLISRKLGGRMGWLAQKY